MEELKNQLISIGFSDDLACILSESVTHNEKVEKIEDIQVEVVNESFLINNAYYCDNITYSSQSGTSEISKGN